MTVTYHIPNQAEMFERASYDRSAFGYRRPSNDTLVSRGGVCVETTMVSDYLVELWMFPDGSYLEVSDLTCNEISGE